MGAFNKWILVGERIRETGNPQKAYEVLKVALEEASNDSERSVALAQIGLCHEHVGELDMAEMLYNEALSKATAAGSIANKGRATRHLSSIEYKRGNLDQALVLAHDARFIMVKAEPRLTDLVWATSQIVKLLIKMKAPKQEIRTWAKLEFKDWKYMFPREKNSIRKWVWTTRWMVNTGRVYPWAFVLIPLAFVISFSRNLRIRTRQMIKRQW